jgi:hypothetical protein
MSSIRTVHTTLLSGDVYSFDVPSNVPLYAVADLLAREILQPSEHMIFFQDSIQISRYSAVLETLHLCVLIRPTPFFYVEKQNDKLVYYREGEEERKSWDPSAVELEDSVIFSREPIEIENYMVRYY